MTTRIIRTAELRRILGGIGLNTLKRMVQRGDFPNPVQITSGPQGIHGWREADVDAWLAARPEFVLPERRAEDDVAEAPATEEE